jgi:hypothetical protein
MRQASRNDRQASVKAATGAARSSVRVHTATSAGV